jgi:hypothetical protein
MQQDLHLRSEYISAESSGPYLPRLWLSRVQL